MCINIFNKAKLCLYGPPSAPCRKNWVCVVVLETDLALSDLRSRRRKAFWVFLKDGGRSGAGLLFCFAFTRNNLNDFLM